MSVSDYYEWFDEIERLKVAPAFGGYKKIYKSLLLLVMLNRGVVKWRDPISAEEVCEDFYHFLNDNSFAKQSLLNEKDKDILRLGRFESKQRNFLIKLIREMPMTKWGENRLEKSGVFENGKFRIALDVNSQDEEELFYHTLNVCQQKIASCLKCEVSDLDLNIGLADEVCEIQKIVNTLGEENEYYKYSYVKSRIGQGKFRNRLIGLYGHCQLTDIHQPELLIASHVKPWKACVQGEHLNLGNGLLLSANLDRLFDNGLISFDTKGKLLVIPSLLQSDDFNNIKKNMVRDKIDFRFEKTESFMDFHRREVFRG